jgi:hypothetical protein
MGLAGAFDRPSAPAENVVGTLQGTKKGQKKARCGSGLKSISLEEIEETVPSCCTAADYAN